MVCCPSLEAKAAPATPNALSLTLLTCSLTIITSEGFTGFGIITGTAGIFIPSASFGLFLIRLINLYPAYPTKPIGPAATIAAAVPTVFNLSAVDFSLNLLI